MKPSLISTSLLLLCLLLVSESQGIRMDKRFMPEGRNEFQKGENSLTKRSNNEGGQGAILCKDENCSGIMKKRVSRVSKKSHHWLPSIHEDYYGPRGHRARHH